MVWKISFQIWQFWISMRWICQSQTLAASRNHLRSTSIMVGMALWGEGHTGSCLRKASVGESCWTESRMASLTLMKLIRWTSQIESRWRWPNGLGNDQRRLMFEGFTARCRKTILRRWKRNDFTDQFPGGAPHVVNVVYQCVSSTEGKTGSKTSNLGSRVI